MTAPTPEDAVYRVLIIDDHRLVADSLALALRAERIDAQVVELADRSTLLAQVHASRPNLVLVDLDLGGELGDGSELIGPCREAGARVLVVSGSTDAFWRGRALEQGAEEVLDKAQPFESLLRDVLLVARGGQLLTAEEREVRVREARRRRESRAALRKPFESLSERERHVLRGLARGKPVAVLAEESYLSEATIRTQVRGVLTKLGVNSQLEAVARMHESGWLLDEPGGQPD